MTRLNFTSNILDQNNPKSKYQCKNELIFIRDFDDVRKNRSRVSSGLKTLGFAWSFASRFLKSTLNPSQYLTEQYQSVFISICSLIYLLVRSVNIDAKLNSRQSHKYTVCVVPPKSFFWSLLLSPEIFLSNCFM